MQGHYRSLGAASPGREAEEQGLKYTAAGGSKKADIIMILINDEETKRIFTKRLSANLGEGNMLIFTLWIQHSFRMYRTAEECRCYHDRSEGSGTYRSFRVPGRKGPPCLIAVRQDATGKAQDLALAYARHR